MIINLSIKFILSKYELIPILIEKNIQQCSSYKGIQYYPISKSIIEKCNEKNPNTIDIINFIL